MSQERNNPTVSRHRDYGATSSSTTAGSFSSEEIDLLNSEIGHNILFIHISTKQLDKQLKLIGTSKDLSAFRKGLHTTNTNTNARVEITTKKLQRLKAIVCHGDRVQKLQLEKLTEEFQKIVEKYSAQQKRISQATQQSYQLAAEAELQARRTAKTEILQQQIKDQEALEREHAMLVERQQQVEMIQADIIDVNVIMNKLNTLVVEQRTAVDNIENTIDQTAVVLEEGRSQLQKAAASRNSHRRKILILLVIAVIIGLIVTGIIVGKLS
ncbi:syntaxin-7 isoform X2 [Drosophila innubila]|uniref:syntaxin-7 isoform X2 n=1 Tax=Drosophila innubila TaxID=198719 RepID=UPI00148CC5E9|nr:syntaxin-7 isoform X2 [Drosophila innubila]